MTRIMGGRTRTEVFVFGVIALCMVGGVSLCLSGLLVPNWVLVTWNENIIIVNARIGLWQDQLCDYEGCRKVWHTDSSYEPNPKATFESRNHVRDLETLGTAISLIALLTLIPLWKVRFGNRWIRIGVHACFFSQSLIAAILCVCGPLVLSSSVHSGHIDWAPCLSGAGGALFIPAAILSCILCLKFLYTRDEEEKKILDPKDDFTPPEIDMKDKING